MVAVALLAASLIRAPEAAESWTRKVSSGSTAVSPRRATVMVRLVAPAAKDTEPLGKVVEEPFPKSEAPAKPDPTGAEMLQEAEELPLMAPLRETRKVKGVEPLLPSACTALRGVIERLESSLPMVAVAVPLSIRAPETAESWI